MPPNMQTITSNPWNIWSPWCLLDIGSSQKILGNWLCPQQKRQLTFFSSRNSIDATDKPMNFFWASHQLLFIPVRITIFCGCTGWNNHPQIWFNDWAERNWIYCCATIRNQLESGIMIQVDCQVECIPVTAPTITSRQASTHTWHILGI